VTDTLETWGDDERTVALVAHNVSTRYLAYLVDAIIGVLMLPFNLAHLGMAAYGLWMLTTSITAYFSMLDLGYGGAIVRFVAQCRARRDARAMNEILSTLAIIYLGIGAAAYAIVLVVAFNLTRVMALTPDQADTGRVLLLIIGAHVALRFVFGIFGGVIVGFQRYHLNNITSIVTSLAVALANAIVLLTGHGIVALVATTTAVRIAALLVYRLNAYRVFPGLALRWRLFRLDRLREVSGFSVFMFVLDGAYKVNYSSDVLVIGALIGAPAIALWAPAQRLTEMTLKLSNQLNDALFPLVVDCDTRQRAERLRTIFIEGTRLSLATAIAIAGGLAFLARPLVLAWIGPSFSASVILVQILAVVVIIRVGAATASVVLKGGGLHRQLTWVICLIAIANLLLSIALVKPMGITGVAIGTLLPVALGTLLGIVPSACRRVGVSLLELFRFAIWPTLWPAVASAALLIAIGGRLPVTLLSVAFQWMVGAFVYVALFLIAVGSGVRQEYGRQLTTLLRRHAVATPQAGTASAS
jgi:O-antigen/teichoic acid export membrane protein